MNFIRERVLSGELLSGGWCSLGSSISAEIAGRAGFDWVLFDIEHGSGDYESLVHQMQAVAGAPAAPIVRIAWNEPPRFKRVLDLGASGVMVPYVNTVEEAKLAVASMRYPPQGIRGVAGLNRATAFGQEMDSYFRTANENLLTIVQVETAQALDNADEIAGVDGVDVLFIGPQDLTTNLGIAQQFDHPRYREALARVVGACRNAGKAPGITLVSPTHMGDMVSAGFTFMAVGSDGAAVARTMRKLAADMQEHKRSRK